ncbi:MAG: hypothetical protein U0794_12140 [Isosphaeraceae bacterium]
MARFARWLGTLRFHHVELHQSAGLPPMVAKRRRWFTRFLFPASNLAFLLFGTGVRFLTEAGWHLREQALGRVLDGPDRVHVSDGWLLMPAWAGSVLAEYVASPIVAPAAKLEAIAAAGRALWAFHQFGPRLDMDAGDLLSHGDATLRNVIYAPSTGTATWFDFDMAHAATLSQAWRQADDLRALLFSAVATMSDATVPEIVAVLQQSYPNPDLWDDLQEMQAARTLHRSLFHLAQACPSRERRRELDALKLNLRE